MKHHDLLPPSSAPALEACAHYRPAARHTAPINRGTDIHFAIAQIASGDNSARLLPVLDDKAEFVKASTAVAWISHHVAKARHEATVVVRDRAGAEITFGTADVVGTATDHYTPIVVDLKSGERRDVRAQVELYALGAMQTRDPHHEACECAVLWLDHNEVDEWTVGYEEAMLRAEALRERVTSGKEAPQECEYCSWCGAKSECPLFQTRASSALQVRDLSELMGELPKKRLAVIAESPELAGAFLVALQAVNALVEESGIKDKVKAYLAEGKSVPGWRLRPSPGRESVSISGLRKWAKEEGVELPDDLFKRGEDGVALIREISKRQAE